MQCVQGMITVCDSFCSIVCFIFNAFVLRKYSFRIKFNLETFLLIHVMFGVIIRISHFLMPIIVCGAGGVFKASCQPDPTCCSSFLHAYNTYNGRYVTLLSVSIPLVPYCLISHERLPCLQSSWKYTSNADGNYNVILGYIWVLLSRSIIFDLKILNVRLSGKL